MNRIVMVLMMIVTLCAPAYAQDNLSVMKYFNSGRTEKNGVNILSMQDTDLEGKKVKLYKSISVSDNDDLSDKIAEAVAHDARKAVSKEVSYKEGNLYFGFYSMGGKGDRRKYLLFLDRRYVKKNKLTLIYIEGNLDSSDVKKMIRK